MPIKFTRVLPKPEPLPPPTYELTGLSKQQIDWLRMALQGSLRDLVGLAGYEDRKAFLERTIRVMHGNPEERQKS